MDDAYFFTYVAMKKLSFIAPLLILALLTGCSSSTPAAASPEAQNPSLPQAQASQEQIPAPALQPEKPPVVPVEQKDATANLYKNTTFGFSLSYSPVFLVNSVPEPDSDTLLTLNYPDTYITGTNLQKADILVSASKSKDAVAKCYTGELNAKPLTTTKMINGLKFYTENWTDGAAGHLGETTTYNLLKGGTCYKLRLEAYSINLGPEISLKAYDKAQIADLFEKVASTFKLL